MGRQIHFHMLLKDSRTFLDFVEKNASVVVTEMVGDSARVRSAKLSERSQWLCLWNHALLPRLERKRIPNAEHEHYRVDETELPVLEFVTSFKAKWEGRPALGQGRLFGIFDSYLGKPPEFEKWYESLVRWIRKNFRRNPTGLGGYVGPAAYEFYEEGGYLLPNFIPPRTKEWLDVIGKQDSRRKPTLRAAQRTRVRD